jgi:hypothetical protein
MDRPAFEWSTATGQADWLAARLAPFGSGRVTSVVPGGFAAYARLLHPAGAARHGHGRTVRWAEVAAWSGTRLAPDSQFHDIALPPRAPTAPAPWRGQGPLTGTLAEQDAAALVEILRGHTATADRCWFCLWDGYGWDSAISVVVAYSDTPSDPGRSDPNPPRPRDPVPRSVRAGPRVRLPGRNYLLYTGAVDAALTLVPDEDQTPNLWWPADRAWCVASEIDLPWSYVAGSEALIAQVLADQRLEAVPAHPGDNIQLRVQGWLADAIDIAVTDLLKSGQATISTARGTLHTQLHRPARSGRGWLRTSVHGARSIHGSGFSALERTPDHALRRRLRLHLTMEVTRLVNS